MGQDSPPFFPPGAFEIDRRYDVAMARLHADIFNSLDEPSLFLAGPDQFVYRFFMLGSWMGMLRFEPTGQTAQLTAKQLRYEGTHPPAKGSYTELTRILTSREWRRFKRLFQKSDFWDLLTVSNVVRLDGNYWTCEVRKSEAYHLVHRWNPRRSGFAKLCGFVLSLKKPPRSNWWSLFH